MMQFSLTLCVDCFMQSDPPVGIILVALVTVGPRLNCIISPSLSLAKKYFKK